MPDSQQLLDHAGRPVAYRRLMVASVLCMTMFGVVQVLLPVCLDSLSTDLALNHEQRGRLLGLRMAALIVSLLVAGHFAQRPVKRHILFFGLLVTAAGQLLTAYAPAYAPLVWAVIVSGLGFGIIEAVLNPLVAQLHPRSSARALNLLNGMFSLGLMVGAFATGELLQARLGWRLPFWLWTLPPLICAVLYLTPRYPAPAADRHDEGPRGQLREFFVSPLFWILIVAMVLGGGCEAGLTGWAANFTSEVLHATPRESALATIFYGGFMALGRFGSGFIVHRRSPLRLMIGSAVLCGLVTLGLMFVPNLLSAWALFALGGLFVACFWPTILAVASDHISAGSTALFSLMAAAGVGGCVIVPWAIGQIGDMCGLRAAVLVLPATMVLLIAMLLWAGRYLGPRARGQGTGAAGTPPPV